MNLNNELVQRISLSFLYRISNESYLVGLCDQDDAACTLKSESTSLL
jgi:hypothetical protein